jgi:hypothetical protein
MKKKYEDLKVGEFWQSPLATFYCYKNLDFPITFISSWVGNSDLSLTTNIGPIIIPSDTDIKNCKKQLDRLNRLSHIDNLTYIENLTILKKYEKPVIIKKKESE